MFAGSLMFSQFNLFDMAVGGWMCFVGFTAVVVGQHTANKLTDLKAKMASESVVKAKFNEMDKDGSGGLDSKVRRRYGAINEAAFSAVSTKI